MERNITLSPEALPYWNMIKDASPKVKKELMYFLIHIPAGKSQDSENEAMMNPIISDEEVKEGIKDSFLELEELLLGKSEMCDALEFAKQL